MSWFEKLRRARVRREGPHIRVIPGVNDSYGLESTFDFEASQFGLVFSSGSESTPFLRSATLFEGGDHEAEGVISA
jgi:hypothetical protein